MANTDLVSKSIQELAASNINELPKEYTSEQSDISDSVPLGEIPIVDLSLVLQSPDLSSLAGEEDDEVQKLRSSLISWGCFQAINHGITSGLLDKVRKVAEEFFALPVEEKSKYLRDTNGLEGYGSGSAGVPIPNSPDWNDFLYLQLTPEDHQSLKYWPQEPNGFRATLQEYTTSLKALRMLILKAMARSLGLAENSFLSQYGESGREIMKAKFTYYPPCPRPDIVLGLKPHADGTVISILLQDREVEGLQILKDDQWFRVPVNEPRALLIFVGDQMQIMSNDILKSPVHRVVTNKEKERISLVVFCNPGTGKEIKPVEKLVNEQNPKVYNSVTNYADSYFHYLQRGIKPIDAVRLKENL